MINPVFIAYNNNCADQTAYQQSDQHNCCLLSAYSKTGLKWPLKNRQN